MPAGRAPARRRTRLIKRRNHLTAPIPHDTRPAWPKILPPVVAARPAVIARGRQLANRLPMISLQSLAVHLLYGPRSTSARLRNDDHFLETPRAKVSATTAPPALELSRLGKIPVPRRNLVFLNLCHPAAATDLRPADSAWHFFLKCNSRWVKYGPEPAFGAKAIAARLRYHGPKRP